MMKQEGSGGARNHPLRTLPEWCARPDRAGPPMSQSTAPRVKVWDAIVEWPKAGDYTPGYVCPNNKDVVLWNAPMRRADCALLTGWSAQRP